MTMKKEILSTGETGEPLWGYYYQARALKFSSILKPFNQSAEMPDNLSLYCPDDQFVNGLIHMKQGRLANLVDADGQIVYAAEILINPAFGLLRQRFHSLEGHILTMRHDADTGYLKSAIIKYRDGSYSAVSQNLIDSFNRKQTVPNIPPQLDHHFLSIKPQSAPPIPPPCSAAGDRNQWRLWPSGPAQ